MSGGTSSAAIRTVEEAGRYLESLINMERLPGPRTRRLSLEPVERLLERLGRPDRGLPVLHVAGSKGKGSTALLCEALLGAAGRRVGTFTSPHLERWTERFRIDGREVAGERLAAAVERLRPHVDALRRDADRAPSFFDATTAAALLLFAEAGVDHAVIEVGLGGRLDSTNVVSPAVTCVTSIELEHTAWLGDTLAAIAGEKAGILKPGVPTVIGDLPPEALDVVVARAEALGCPVARLGVDFHAEAVAEDADGVGVRLRDGDLVVAARLPTLGAHHAANAALALACVRRLGPEAPADARLAEVAPAALAAAELPGRTELLGRRPWLVVDSAHTQVSAAALARSLERIPRRRTHLVLSVSSGKNLDAICRALVPAADEVTLTRAEPVRSLDPAQLAAAVRAVDAEASLRVVPNPHLAVRAAREALGPEDLLCAAGSVYLAGVARRILAPDPKGKERGRVVVSRRSDPDRARPDGL